MTAEILALRLPTMGVCEFQRITGCTQGEVALILEISPRQARRIFAGDTPLKYAQSVTLATAAAMLQQRSA